jgi:hypothetical protein
MGAVMARRSTATAISVSTTVNPALKNGVVLVRFWTGRFLH